MFSKENKKNIFSNAVLLSFLVFLTGTIYLSFVFKTNQNTIKAVSQDLKILSTGTLNQVNKIVFKNKNGEFNFEKNEANQVSPWQMTTPRSINANSTFFEKLFNLLSTTNIKKIYPNDKINNSNFSLEKPTANMDLYLSDGRFVHLDFGLLNTIDNSIYLKANTLNGIIHIEAPSLSFENLNLLDLIESQIFNFDLENLVKFKIYRQKKTSEPMIEILKNNKDWIAKDGSQLNTTKLDDYFFDLSFLKSSYILDKQTDSQKKQISNLKHNSEYIISIEDNKKNVIDYHISGIIKDISGIDLKGEPHFLITISNSNTAYLVKKDFFSLFDIKIDKFK